VQCGAAVINSNPDSTRKRLKIGHEGAIYCANSCESQDPAIFELRVLPDKFFEIAGAAKGQRLERMVSSGLPE